MQSCRPEGFQRSSLNFAINFLCTFSQFPSPLLTAVSTSERQEAWSQCSLVLLKLGLYMATVETEDTVCSSLPQAQPVACWTLTWTYPEFCLCYHPQAPRLPPRALSQGIGKMTQKPLGLCGPETRVLETPRRRDTPFHHGLHRDRGIATVLIPSLIPPGPRRAKVFDRHLNKRVNA